MVDQGGELVDSLAEPALGPELAHEHDDLGHEEERVPVLRVPARGGEGGPDGREPLVGQGGEDEVEGSGPGRHPGNTSGGCREPGD
jgi:hypothetical protein